MYRKKLLEQIAILEERQKRCTSYETEDVIEIGKQILSLAKQLDQYDAGNSQMFVTIDGEKIVIPNTSEK